MTRCGKSCFRFSNTMRHAVLLSIGNGVGGVAEGIARYVSLPSVSATRRNSNSVLPFAVTVLLMPSITPPLAVVQCSSTVSLLDCRRHEPLIQAGKPAADADVAMQRRRIILFMHR